jgi:hypothetical protein
LYSHQRHRYWPAVVVFESFISKQKVRGFTPIGMLEFWNIGTMVLAYKNGGFKESTSSEELIFFRF